MKKTLLGLLLFWISASNAQVIFEKGYFIGNDKTRTECYIKNEDWRNNPSEFEYKLALADNDSKRQYRSGVEEFGIDNVSRYKRFKVKMERSADDVNNLTKSGSANWKEETVFLKTVVSGNATLYEFVDENITKYFYETGSIPIEQLVYIKYLSNQKNTSGSSTFDESIKENNQFRQQLLNALKCNSLSENDFKNLQYKKNQLVSVFVKYNQCSGSTTTSKSSQNFQDATKRKSFALRFTPGIFSSNISVSDPDTAYNASTDLHAAVFKIGVEFEYLLPFNKNAWSIFLNPAYQNVSAENNYTKSDGLGLGQNATTYNAKLTYSSIEIPIGFRHYFYLNPSSKIFVNAAYVIDISNAKSKLEITNAEDVNGNKLLEVNSRNNFAFGLGFSYKRFGIEIRTNTGRELLGNYISWSAKYSATGAILSYQFL
ncbi:MAG TPA: hypothetical protein VK528_08530 [Flavobacterium sp.]|nr:hypothetical protein [Flavobacterium sp.]